MTHYTVERRRDFRPGPRVRSLGLVGLVGGLLWALWPFGTPFVLAGSDAPDTLGIAYGASFVIPAALILVGLWGIHAIHTGTYGRLGVVGTVVSAVAVAAMGIGLALDAVGLGLFLDRLSVAGHTGFLLGFLALVIGSIVLGAAIYRASRLPRARLVGLWLAVAIPVGFVLQILIALAGIPEPGEDFYFWMGLLTTYGIAWVVLGFTLRRTRETVRTHATDAE